jgi:hypothetical protein
MSAFFLPLYWQNDSQKCKCSNSQYQRFHRHEILSQQF